MEFWILRGDIVSAISRDGGKISSGPKLSAPIALAQLRELYLDPIRRAPFDMLHDIVQGQFWRCRQEHVDVIAAQNALQYEHANEIVFEEPSFELASETHVVNFTCLTIK